MNLLARIPWLRRRAAALHLSVHQHAYISRQAAAVVGPDDSRCHCCGQRARPSPIPGTLGLSDHEVELIDAARVVTLELVSRMAPAPWWPQLWAWARRVFTSTLRGEARG